jgi:multicomponent Na+:H+ antiporter subunit F
MLGEYEILSTTTNIVLGIMLLATLIALIRLALGPGLPDRVVALDLVGSVVAGVIAVYAIANNQPVFVDVAIVMSLIIFLGTIAFARYLERRIVRDD